MKLEVTILKENDKESGTNNFSAKDFIEKYVQSNQENGENNAMTRETKSISGWIVFLAVIIVVVNFFSDISQNFKWKFYISSQTNILAVLLVIFLVINSLFWKTKKD